MRNKAFAAVFSLLLALALFAQQQAAPVAANQRIVVLLSIDGLPAFAFDDPRVPAPTLKRLAREGVMAKGMRVVNPSVTWPNHTTMVTGVAPAEHSVLANGMIIRPGPRMPLRIEPWRDKAEMVRATTVYDLAYKAGLTTAQVDWVAIYNPGTITWEFPERPRVKGAIEQEMVRAGLLTESDIDEFNSKSNPPWRDQMWTRAAVHIIQKHKPNLLLFHLLNLDTTHHRYGPRTLASQIGIAQADARVREVLDAIEAAGLRDRATVLVVADHGFRTFSKVVRPNTALRAAGLLKGEGKTVECDAWVIPEGGTALAYVTNESRRAELLPKLREMFAGMEGVDRVYGASEYPALGLPDPAKNNQSPDLFLTAKNGYSFAGQSAGELVVPVGMDSSVGAHGYIATDPDMNAVFIAWGYGVRRGATLDVIDNTAIAPTVARLLGVKMQGRGLDILTQ